MKLNHIALVVVTAICAAGVAHAVPQTVWSAGSSSSTKAQFKAFKSNCGGGNVHVYMNSGNPVVTADSLPGDTSTGNFFAYQCTFDATKIAPGMVLDYGGQSVTLFHTVDGGSFMAFAPFTNLRRITAAASIGCTGNFPPSMLNPGVTVHKGCAIFDPAIVPDGGFADVEATMWPVFPGKYTWNFANVAQLFGVVVSDALYIAMQTKQLADPLPGAPGLGLPGLPGCTAAMLSLDKFAAGPCQPSISPDQYRSIISVEDTGGPWQTDWVPLVGTNGSPALTGAGKVVNLCRRVDTSGTQASSNVFFLENPCRQWSTQPGPLSPQTKTATNANYIVTEGAGTGDVKACLNNANNNATVNNRFAIGVMSMENIPAATDHFHFVKIGGASGNLDAKQRAAGAKGVYPFVMETVYTASPARQAFFDELASDLADPSLDLAGLFVLPQAPQAGTPDGDIVGFGTKLSNNCAPQLLFF